MTAQSPDKTRIAILASGGGSNAEAIMEYFADHPTIEVGLVVSNRRKAGVFERAKRHKVPAQYVPKSDWQNEALILDTFEKKNIHFVVLAGFLLLIPRFLTLIYHNRIVNIHPALLPKYGGVGMYGMNVHRAVKANNETESGITIHLVNDKYDDGEIRFQASVFLAPEDTPETIAQKVLALEHEHYAPQIEHYIQFKNSFL